MTAKVLEVIHTTRRVGSGQSEDDIVHEHHQHWTTDGDLLVEWCDLDADCGYRRGPMSTHPDA